MSKKEENEHIAIEDSIETIRICTNLKCLSKTTDPDLGCCPRCGQELQDLQYGVQKKARHRH
ncbi:MAG: hypothetical protein MUO26_09215 [Methanotrichaceae archaeon]|nr:hypothetical protein [Methanotrichaceae archaeon]